MKDKKAVDIIKKWETLHDGDLTAIGLQPKLCPAGFWTVGYGHLVIDPITKKPLTKEFKQRAYELYPCLTVEQAEELLKQDMALVTQQVTKAVTAVIDKNMFEALVSFVFNLGIGNFSKSTLLKLINANKFKKAAEEFDLWVYSGKKVLPGLVKRRLEEKELFLRECCNG